MLRYFFDPQKNKVLIVKDENFDTLSLVEISQQQFEDIEDQIILKKNFKIQDGSIVLDEEVDIVSLTSKIRRQRNALLSSSDWTQISDSPLTEEKKNEWKAYRQALRDLPSLPDFPNVMFPEKPQ